MKRLTLRNRGPKLGIRQIKMMEKQLGCELPESYKKFFLKNNGGIPNRSFYYLKSLKENPYPQCVSRFFFIDKNLAKPSSKADVFSISYNRYLFKEVCPNVIPDDSLVIGEDERENMIILRIKGRRYGQVALKLVGEAPEPQENTDQNVYKIAKTFSDFLDTLLDNDEIEDEDEDEE